MRLLRAALCATVLLTLNSLAHAQTFTQLQWGVNRGATPSPICVMNGSACLGQISTLNTSTGLMTLTVGASDSNATFPSVVTGNTDLYRFATGSFPKSSEFGANAAPIVSGLVSGVTVPNTYGGVAPFGLVGYTLSDSSSGGVGTAGFGLVSANGSPAWGLNSGVANCPELTTCITGHGHNNVVLWGNEIDVALDSVLGVPTPSFALRGIQLTGDVRMPPSQIGLNVFRAIEVSTPGINQTPVLPWNQGLFFTEGATLTAIDIGATGTGNGVGSQAMFFRSRTAGGVNGSTLLLNDAGNNFVIVPAANALIALQDGIGNNILTTQTSGVNATNLTLSGTLILPLTGYMKAHGASAVTASATVPLSDLATQATNTIVGNATSGTAAPTALAIGSCDTATKAVQWTTNTGFGCNSAINAATLGGATFAAPGPIGSGTPGTGAFTTLSATGQFTSTLATGTAPFSIASTTVVPNLYVARAQSADAMASTGFANPTASLGLTAVNGSATTAMRSDAAPALSQSIVPTWSGIHTFSAAPVMSLGVKYSGSSSGTVTVLASATAGTPTVTWGNTSGTPAVTASAPLALSTTTGNLTVTGAAGQVLAGASPAFTATPTLGVAGSTVGSLAFANATSGSITLQPVAGALGSAVLTLPAATDTIAVLAAAQALTNKDLSGAGNTFPTFNQNTTGSAAKWTTARNLAGNSVDGSANVAFANKFIVQGTADTGLSAAQFLGALGTGLLKNTTTTGVLSIASAGTDYLTSVGVSFTGGLISVGSSPLTSNGTIALTVAGTSGGIPYFSSTSAWASSALLTANALMIGGGAGAAPATTTTGTGALTALGVNVGTAGAFVVNGGALGTPSSGTLSSATGLPISTGVSGLGTGVATFLGTPSSANLAAAITDETGSGALVFATSPTLVTPALGVATGTTLALNAATLGNAKLAVLNGAGTSGAQGLDLNVTQTTVNTSDTADSGFNIGYTLSAASASNQLISRAMRFNITNSLTGGGSMSSFRAMELVSTANVSTTTGIMDHLYVLGAGTGTVTTAIGLHIGGMVGTTKYGIEDDSTGSWWLSAITATAAGTSASPAILFGSSKIGIYFGSGAPSFSAAQGSIYIRSDGSSTSTRLYVNTTGSTTWTNFTSAT